MGMIIPQRTANGTALIPIESMAFEQRTIYIDGDITAEVASEFVRQILMLNRQDATKPIKVIITSNGGSVVHGLAMYDAICTSKAPVETFCVGTAYSMGAIIFVAGKRRMLLEHSKLMLHEPLIGEGIGGNASSIKSMSDSLQNTKEELNSILCKHTGRTKEEMDDATKYDHYFSAEEAIEFGLADEIVGLDRVI